MKESVRISTILSLLMAASVSVSGQPQYEVLIDSLPRFQHIEFGRENQLASGACCASFEPAPPCRVPCQFTMIDICLREIQHPIDSDFNNCPLGLNTYRSFDFGPAATFQPTQDAVTTIYPGAFQLVYRIRSSDNQLIDAGSRTISEPITARENPIFYTYLLDGENALATLIIDRIAVVCRNGFNGLDCSTKSCTPRDDVGGHFTCDENLDRVCLPGYQNPETNCIEPEGSTQQPTNATDSNTAAAVSTTDQSGEDDGVPIELAAGAGAGALLLLLLILVVNVVIVTVYMKRRRKNKGRSKEDNNDADMETNPMYYSSSQSGSSTTSSIHISKSPLPMEPTTGESKLEESDIPCYVEIIAEDAEKTDDEHAASNGEPYPYENVYEHIS